MLPLVSYVGVLLKEGSLLICVWVGLAFHTGFSCCWGSGGCEGGGILGGECCGAWDVVFECEVFLRGDKIESKNRR